MNSAKTIIFLCTVTLKADTILGEDQRELFAIENSLHELRTCSQSFDDEHVPEFCYSRQSKRADELSRKSRFFWGSKGQDDQCIKTPCSRKSHKISTKVNYIPPNKIFYVKNSKFLLWKFDAMKPLIKYSEILTYEF